MYSTILSKLTLPCFTALGRGWRDGFVTISSLIIVTFYNFYITARASMYDLHFNIVSWNSILELSSLTIMNFQFCLPTCIRASHFHFTDSSIKISMCCGQAEYFLLKLMYVFLKFFFFLLVLLIFCPLSLHDPPPLSLQAEWNSEAGRGVQCVVSKLCRYLCAKNRASCRLPSGVISSPTLQGNKTSLSAS